MRRCLLACVALCAGTSCRDYRAASEGAAKPTGPAESASIACPDGFAPLSGDAGCEPVLAPEGCFPGTRPVIGSTTCKAVGWTDCPFGFAPHPSGWGCLPVLPAPACTGFTLE